MRYPTDSRGLALPIQELGYEEVPYSRGKTNNHHLYFEKRRYMGSQVAKLFRGLAPHVTTMWVPNHCSVHQDFEGPKIPPRTLMIDVLDEYAYNHGELHIVREQNTNELYTITANDWSYLRDGTKAY